MDFWGEGDLPRATPGKEWESHKEPVVLGNLLPLSMIWHPKSQCPTEAVQTFMSVPTSLQPGEPRGSQPAWKPSEISFMLRCKAASNWRGTMNWDSLVQHYQWDWGLWQEHLTAEGWVGGLAHAENMWVHSTWLQAQPLQTMWIRKGFWKGLYLKHWHYRLSSSWSNGS